MNKKKVPTGFSLMEVMVVIAIIAVLSAAGFASYSSSREKARDAVRISDVQQLQLLLEFYRDNNGAYPDTGLSQLVSGGFISTLPVQPRSGSDYDYEPISSGVSYVLSTDEFESTGNLPNDDLDGTVGTTDCDDSGPVVYCVQP